MIVLAASARKTMGLISGPAITARQPEKRAKTSAPIIVVIVCVPTPSGTARMSSSCWPKIISEKTTQKTNITSPQMRPEVTEATADWRDMPRSARSALRHTLTSDNRAIVTGRRRRYMSPACSFLVSGSMGSGALSGATLGRSRETRRDPTTAIAMNFCAQASSCKNLDDGTQG